jgi:antitoxin CptB
MTEMVTEYTMTEVEVKRLGWRCRRGLLELDIVLQRFSAKYLAELSNDELVVFDILLDYPDNELLDVVTLRKELKNLGPEEATFFKAPALQQLLEKLRTT